MKKLLSILAALVMTTTSAAGVVACGSSSSNNNNNNNDTGWSQWTTASDAKWELVSGEVSGTNGYGKFITPDNGQVKGKLTLSINHNAKNEFLNAEELFRLTTRKNPFWTNRDPLNKSMYSFDIDFGSRQSIDSANDSIVVNVSLNLGENRDYDYVQFITIQYMQINVKDLNNGNYNSTFEDMPWQDSSIFVQQIILNKWWDNSSDFYKAKDIKLVNDDGVRKLSFTFKAKKGDDTNFVLGKGAGGNGDYTVIDNNAASGSISRTDSSITGYDLFEAKYSFTIDQWKDFSLYNSEKNWMYNLGISTKIDSSDYYAEGIRALVESKAEADEIIKAENNVSISLDENNPFAPSTNGVELNTQVGPFIDLTKYNLKAIVKVGKQDLSDFFVVKADEKGKVILDAQNKKVYSKAAQWNMFIKKYNDILATDNSAKINIQLSGSTYNGDPILSNVLQTKMPEEYVESEIKHDKEKIMYLDNHYVTGIYIERTAVVDYEYKDNITKVVGLMNNGNVSSIITNQEIIKTYGSSLALVKFDMHLLNLSEDEDKTIGIGYRPDYISTGQDSYEIGELKVSTFYPKGFVDSSFSIEGYDSKKGVQISSEKRSALIGKISCGENINLKNLKVTLSDQSSIQPIDAYATGINVYLNNDSLFIELTDKFNGRCIRPYDFNGSDDAFELYGAYKLKIDISVPTKLNSYETTTKTIDKINYSPNEADTISVDNYVSQHLSFVYDQWLASNFTVETDIDIKRSGENVDWEKFNSSIKHFKAINAKYGSGNGDLNSSIQWVNSNMDVSYDNDAKKIKFKINGNSDVNGSTYLMKDGACVIISLDLKTKDGHKVIFNQTNTFTIYFRNK